MEKKILLMLLVAFGLVAGAARANLLVNPSFEEGTFAANDPPLWWYDSSPTYTSNMTWFDDAAGAHSGSRYIKMNSWWSWSSTGWFWQSVNVTPGQEYAFSVWAKCSLAGETSEARGYYEYLDFGGVIIDSGWLPQGWDVGSNWTYTEFGTAAAPASATQAVYYLAGVLENSAKGVLFDDAYMDIALPSLPSPNWEDMVAIGDVDLSWTNLAPNDPNDSMYVDVLLGTEPNETHPSYDMAQLTLDSVSGQDVTLATAEGLDIGTYYWQVDSYIYGDPCAVLYDIHGTDPNGWPIIKGLAWSFDVVADAPPSSADVGVDMITWAGEPIALDATIVDDGTSPLTIAWSSNNPPGTDVLFSDPNIEDPTVTITKVSHTVAELVNPSFEDRLTGWDSFGDGGHGTWNGTFGNKTYLTPTDGDLIAYVDGNYGDPVEGGWISQTLTETFTADTTYTLTVDVANDGYYDEDVQYKVQLLAGGAVLAEDDDSWPLPLGPGGKASDWQTSTVICTLGGPSDPNFAYVGEPLEIRLVAKVGTIEMSFDNVQLTADPPFPAPGLSTVELTVVVADEANQTYVLKDSMTIDIYDDACAAAHVGLSLAADNPGDVDADCNTDLADLAEMVITWLDEPDGLPTEAIIGLPGSTLGGADGLIEYWQLDGDYSAEVTSTHEGTLTTTGTGSGTFVTGKFGNAIDLENSASNQAYVAIGGDENDFDFAGESISVSLWYTTESLYASWQCLVAKGEDSNWRLHRSSGSTTDIDFYTSLSVTGDGELDQQDGSWHHIVATADTVDGAKLYIDGSLVNSASGAVALAGNTVAMQIGGNPDGAGRGWDGILDDVGVWNRALGANEVSALWNGGIGASIESFIVTDPNLPTVNAGNDWITWSGEPVDPNASAVNNGTGDLTYAWTADPAAGVVFSATDVIDPTVTITKAASTGGATAVTLTLAVNNEGSGKDPVTDSIVIDVCDDACQAKIATGQAPPYDPGDVNLDCVTELTDFALLAKTWFDDYTLTEPAVKP